MTIPQADRGQITCPRLMTEMMEHLGIDAEQSWARTSGFAITRAARTCRECRTRDACAAWLAEPSADQDHWAFCPNAHLFERMPRKIRL